jgi:hypothetical protein
MDVWLLGAAAIVLVAITVWIVWPTRTADALGGDATQLPPQGDAFEDQYTSATADLSAGGVAEALAEARAPGVALSPVTPEPTPYQSAGEPWSSASIAREGIPVSRRREDRAERRPPVVGLGAAALLTVGGAIGGAWLYARWQRQRNTPLHRLKRTILK